MATCTGPERLLVLGTAITADDRVIVVGTQAVDGHARAFVARLPP